MTSMNAVQLTQELIRFNSVNPPGNEGACARFVARLLSDWGLLVELVDYEEGRPCVVGRLPGRESGAPLCFTGHLDTVPLGSAPWQHEPFAGEIADGRIYGRGASDMKSGLAAVLVAVERLSRERGRLRDTWVIFTVAEETGCEGAQKLAASPTLLPHAGALVVAEPTGNRVAVAHKGALRLRLDFEGKSAHGSMPEQGSNAILSAARGAIALHSLDFAQAPHPQLGQPTLNVGTIAGGTAINMVPDHAELGLDIRTVPGMSPNEVRAAVVAAVGAPVEVTTLRSAEAVSTPAEHPWVETVSELTAELMGRSESPIGMPYFTDASYLVPAMRRPPTVVLGPGEPSQAHVTDEWCETEAIRVATEIYHRICSDWCLGRQF